MAFHSKFVLMGLLTLLARTEHARGQGTVQTARSFAWRVNVKRPCGLSNAVLAEPLLTEELYTNTVVLRVLVRDIQQFMEPFSCNGNGRTLNLSLPSFSCLNSSVGLNETLVNFHRSLVNSMVYLFFMRKDWAGGRMPCVSRDYTMSLQNKLNRIELKMKEVVCLAKMKALDLSPASRAYLEASEEAGLSLPVARYPACSRRKLRDCLVLSSSRRVSSTAVACFRALSQVRP